MFKIEIKSGTIPERVYFLDGTQLRASNSNYSIADIKDCEIITSNQSTNQSVSGSLSGGILFSIIGGIVGMAFAGLLGAIIGIFAGLIAGLVVGGKSKNDKTTFQVSTDSGIQFLASGTSDTYEEIKSIQLKHKLKTAQPVPTKLSEKAKAERMKKIKKLIREKKSIQEIADILETSPNSIRAALMREGLPIPD